MMNPFFWLIVFSPILAEGFILTGSSCVASQQCPCSNNAVNCNFRSLMEIPKFASVPEGATAYLSKFYIRLSGNQITTVPGHAFQNISSINASQLYMYLDINKINTIDTDAFKGVENSLTHLQLQNNQLKIIPAAFGTLRSLESLYIYGNPIQSLDASAVSSLGRSLTYFWIDMGSFQSWPYEVGRLQRLETLVLGYIRVNQTPIDAFQGLGPTLHSLTIAHSNLSTVPSALCDLPNLKTFTFQDNNIVHTDKPLFDRCQQEFANLSIVWLSRNQLKSFSNVFQMFRHVRHINLEENDIAAVEPSLVPIQNQITSLNIKKNKLSSIPAVVTKMKSLDTLHLSFNNITRIDEDDLKGLNKLSYLDIDNNPLQYVSPRAFQDNHDLEHIDMEHGNLTAIPAGVLSLPKLYFFPLMGNKVVCNCSMANLKHWNVTNVPFFTGFCNGDALDQTLIKYISGPLQNCP